MKKTNDEFINEKSVETQKAQIRQYLLDGNKITPLEALRMFGSLRLAAIIFTLRDEGMDIVTERIKVGKGKMVAQYSLAV
jgi:hypothetical protein